MIYNPDNSIDSIYQDTTHEKEVEPKSLKEIFLDFKEKISEKVESLNEQFKSLTSSIKNPESMVEEIQEMDNLNSGLKTLTSQTEEELWDLWEQEDEDNTTGETISSISNDESGENLSHWWDSNFPNFPKPPEDGDEKVVTMESIVEEGSDDSSNWWDLEDGVSTETTNIDDSPPWPLDEVKYWEGLLEIKSDDRPTLTETVEEQESNYPIENFIHETGNYLAGGGYKLIQKVGNQMGSNEGGLYKNPYDDGHELYYVKFYKDPNQGRIENIANTVYRKLGIGAPESETGLISGKSAFVSKIIEGSAEMDEDSIRSSYSVKKGFVADAFLGNWDVIGLEFDNIKRGSNGKTYRIDNGGALTFRAQGLPKEYSSNNIPELDSLLNPNINLNSAFVFEGLTEEEIRKQAQDLVYLLKESDIIKIVSDEHLPEEIEKKLITSMLGRRNFLISKYHLETERAEKAEIEGDGITRLIKALNTAELRRTDESYGHCGMRGDKGSIARHEIDIYVTHDGDYNIYFKTTPEHRKNPGESKLTPMPAKVGTSYSFTSAKGEKYTQVNFGSYDIAISQNTTISLPSSFDNIKAIKGAVMAKVRGDLSPQQVAEEINQAMKILGISDGLEEPDSESITNYLRNRYRWWQKIPEGDEIEDKLPNLRYEEVFTDYWTPVDKEAVERFTKEHNIVLTHSIQNFTNIVGILKEGLMCSHERYKRGLIIEGLSTMEDFNTGGADSVFTRLVSEVSADRYSSGWGGTLIISPEVLGRTDWYAYPIDKYGVSEGDEFDNRLSADNIVEMVSKDIHSSNEFMFPKGIDPTKIQGICVNTEENKERLIEMIKNDLKLEEFNGIPLEDFVVATNSIGDYYRIRNLS